jgi:hypothetical protein
MIVDKVLDRLGAIARTRVVPDRSPAGVGFLVRTDFTHEPLELRSSQPPDLPANVGHDWGRIIGAVRQLEVGGDRGEVWAVADIYGELPRDERLYFSTEGRSGGRDGAELSALAVTPAPGPGSAAPRCAYRPATYAGARSPRR